MKYKLIVQNNWSLKLILKSTFFETRDCRASSWNDAKNKELDKEKYNIKILSELYDKGIINEEGKFINQSNSNEMSWIV